MGVNFEYLFLGLFVAIAGYFVFNLIRHNGLKGALFGGRIVETFGEVPGTKLRELPDDADSAAARRGAGTPAVLAGGD
jgi:hypothetical protein